MDLIMKLTTYIINTTAILALINCIFRVYKHKFSYDHTDYPQYAWLALLIAVIACIVWAVIKEIINNKNKAMTQKQFTDFLQANNCLDKYTSNYNASPFKECEWGRWFDMVDHTNLITSAFMYPTNQYGLWIDLNNKYKLFLKELNETKN